MFAIDDTCSHQDASLADGWLEGCEIECPLHASRFNLRTGAVDAPPAKRPMRTHAVVVEDGVIRVVLERRDRPTCRPASPARAGRGEQVKRVAIVGASLAGLSAARALRAQGFDGELTVVGDETRRPYDRPPLSKEFLAGDVAEADLALESDDEDLDAQWLLGAHATRLDAAAGAVELADGTAVERRRHGDRDGLPRAPLARLRSARRCARDPHHRRRGRAARKTFVRALGWS